MVVNKTKPNMKQKWKLQEDTSNFLILIITNIGNLLATAHCVHTEMPDVLLYIIDIPKPKV